MNREIMHRILWVLRDPGMGYRRFILHQTDCYRHTGKIDEVLTVYGTGGVIQPGTEETRKLLPEEFRREEFITVYCHSPVTPGRELDKTHFRAADVIDPYDGTYWRVVSVREWGKFPEAYWEAQAVRTDENPWDKRKEKRNHEGDDL